MLKWVIILLVFVNSGYSSFMDWLGMQVHPPKTKVNVNVPLIRVPFEELDPEEKFLIEASKITGLKLDELDVCQQKLVLKLKTSCGELSDEELSKLAVGLLNCQSDVEGRKVYPCTAEMSLRECTREMDPETWNSYHVVSNRARAVCYAARQDQFRALAEITVNKLMIVSQDHINQMALVEERQVKLGQSTEAILKQLLQSQTHVLASYSNLKKLESSLISSIAFGLNKLEVQKELLSNVQGIISSALKKFHAGIGNKYNAVKVDADLDDELEYYDVESSDDGLDADDRILLGNARGRKLPEEEEEVLPVHEASSESESYDNYEEIDDSDGEEKKYDEDIYGGGISSGMESDEDDKSDGLPDSKAWGIRRKDYYNTDYIDKDFSGFDDEEAAIMEEEEAKAIQQRLLGQLEDVDFSMGLLDKVEEKKKEVLTKAIKPEVEEKIKIDFSKLSEQELKEFDDRETPGFNKVKDDCKNYAKYAQKILHPILNSAKISKITDCPALDLIKAKYYLILRFCLNVTFLLRLKSYRTANLDRHPVIKRLLQISKYLKEIDAAEKEVLRSQILRIAKALMQNKQLETKRVVLIDSGVKEKEITGKNRKERRKKMLLLLAEKKETEKVVEKKEKKLRFADDMENTPLETCAKELEQITDATAEESEDSDNEGAQEGEKRAITYQMLKNKGLTPKRKKEVRNPRIRNKNKYKKAIVRRKGQVKIARKELKKYDGEISGIKKNLSRSIKLK